MAFRVTEDNFIVVDQDVLNGNPHVVGTRLTVFDIVSDCKYEGIDFFVNSSQLSRTQLHSVLGYCKDKLCDHDGGYCGGCSLRPVQDGVHDEEEFVNRFSEVRFTESDEVLSGNGEGVMVMPGTPETLSETWRGQDGWLIALDLFQCL